MLAHKGIPFLLIVFILVSVATFFSYNTSVKHRARTSKKSMNISRITMKANASGWKVPALPKYLQHADQENMDLIRHIRRHWIIPPQTTHWITGQLDTGWYKDYSEQGQPLLIDRLLNSRRNGFVVECGAADGFISSNSLYFELQRNWTGILIEGNPKYFQSLLDRRRHMYTMNACLSPRRTPVVVDYALNDLGGGIAELIPPGQKVNWEKLQVKTTAVQCFPLYSIMAALQISHVDYFSLDVEGAEVDILRNFPLDRIEVDSFTIEKRVKDDEVRTEQKEELLKTMLPGYRMVTKLALDLVFLKKAKGE